MSSTSVQSAPSSGQAEVISWSKDSIYVRWRFDGSQEKRFDGDGLHTSGYMIRYQAIGSSIIQQTRLLDTTTSSFDITQLHENTNYDICVLRMGRSYDGSALYSTASALFSQTTQSMSTVAKACVKGTTTTDSLSVALGSTLGAFLALSFIVALVFVAKWQHVRRSKKRLDELDCDSAEIGELAGIEDEDEYAFRVGESIMTDELDTDNKDIGITPSPSRESSMIVNDFVDVEPNEMTSNHSECRKNSISSEHIGVPTTSSEQCCGEHTDILSPDGIEKESWLRCDCDSQVLSIDDMDCRD